MPGFVGLVAALAAVAATLPHLLSPISKPVNIPPDLLVAGRHYAEVFSFTVSPLGQVLKCKVVSSDGAPSADESVCNQLRSGAASPAIGRDGKPSYGKMNVSYSWPDDGYPKPVISDVDLTVEKLPRGLPLHARTGLALTVDTHGQIQGCDVENTSGSQALDLIACSTTTSKVTKQPVLDRAGASVASIQSIVVGFAAYSKTVFKRDSRYASLGDGGPYTPDRALRLGVRGYASLACIADAAGQLENCTLDEEAPFGFAFGRAAEKMASSRFMQVAPGAPGPVLVKVDFSPRPSSSSHP